MTTLQAMVAGLVGTLFSVGSLTAIGREARDYVKRRQEAEALEKMAEIAGSEMYREREITGQMQLESSIVTQQQLHSMMRDLRTKADGMDLRMTLCEARHAECENRFEECEKRSAQLAEEMGDLRRSLGLLNVKGGR